MEKIIYYKSDYFYRPKTAPVLDNHEIYEATIEAESYLLGSLLAIHFHDPTIGIDYHKWMQDVSQIVAPEDFIDAYSKTGIHFRIYSAMLQCEHIDVVSVIIKMVEDKTLFKNDLSYITHLPTLVPCPADYLFYAKAVKEYAMQREVKKLADRGDFKRINEITGETAYKGLQID